MDSELLVVGGRFYVVAIAASVGGLNAIAQVLRHTSETFSAAVVIVQHRSPASRQLAAALTYLSNRTVLDAVEGDHLRPGCVLLAPAEHHLVVNADHTVSVTKSPKINYNRPSADVMFCSGAECLGKRLIAVVLTGTLADGSAGVKHVHLHGGQVIAQDRNSSVAFGMPGSAAATGCVDWVLPLDEIGPALTHLVAQGTA